MTWYIAFIWVNFNTTLVTQSLKILAYLINANTFSNSLILPIVGDINLYLYRLFFGRDCNSKFGGTKF